MEMCIDYMKLNEKIIRTYILHQGQTLRSSNEKEEVVCSWRTIHDSSTINQAKKIICPIMLLTHQNNDASHWSLQRGESNSTHIKIIVG